MDEGRCGREWYVFPHRSRPLHPSSVSLTRASTTFYGIAATGSYVRFNSLRDAPPGGEAFNLPHRGRGTAAAVDEGRCGSEWYVFPHRSRPERPSSVRATPCQLPRRGSFLTFPSGEGGSPQARRNRGVTGPPNTVPAGPDTGRRALPGGCRCAPGWPGCSAGPPVGCSGSRSARWTGAAACSRWNT